MIHWIVYTAIDQEVIVQYLSSLQFQGYFPEELKVCCCKWIICCPLDDTSDQYNIITFTNALDQSWTCVRKQWNVYVEQKTNELESDKLFNFLPQTLKECHGIYFILLRKK